jgi:hypothetical protein
MAGGKCERKKILLPHFAAAVRASHFDEAGDALQPDGDVTGLRQRFEVPPRAATEVEDRKWRLAFDML